MKISTSYCYQIRYFKPNMLPISTAVWDPRWFHTGKNIGEYKDSHGVWNGIRMPILSPASFGNHLCDYPSKCKPEPF